MGDNHKGASKREAGRSESEETAQWKQAERCSHKPRNAGGLWGLEKVRKGSSPAPPGGAQTC